MPVSFSPHRQGAQHCIEPHHVVLLRGTSVYDPNVGTYDTRICVGANGVSARAMWFHYPKHVNVPGLIDEFHLWSYQLLEQDVESIRDTLRLVYQQFVRFDLELAGNDCGDLLTFWAGANRFSACLHRPADARRQHTQEQIAAFSNACNKIYELVPQPSTVPVDPLRRTTYPYPTARPT